MTLEKSSKRSCTWAPSSTSLSLYHSKSSGWNSEPSDATIIASLSRSKRSKCLLAPLCRPTQIPQNPKLSTRSQFRARNQTQSYWLTNLLAMRVKISIGFCSRLRKTSLIRSTPITNFRKNAKGGVLSRRQLAMKEWRISMMKVKTLAFSKLETIRISMRTSWSTSNLP